MAATEPFEGLAPTFSSDFRPIHYLGNKSRILATIETVVDVVAPEGARVCDLFAGSGVVSRRLARRHPVIAADIQEYSRVLSSALLNPARDPDLSSRVIEMARPQEKRMMSSQLCVLIDHEVRAIDDALSGNARNLAAIVEHGSLWRSQHRVGDPGAGRELADLMAQACTAVDSGPGAVITRYYGGIYFSYEQAVAIDSLAAAARCLGPQERDTAIAAILSVASELVATVGSHFAQPIRAKGSDGSLKLSLLKGVAAKRLRSVECAFGEWLCRYQSLQIVGYNHEVQREDFRTVLATLPEDTAAVYADPPYTRDHYSRFYHVLETLALGDEPGVSMMTLGGTVQPSRALYRRERHQSPFCIRSQVIPAFRSLFAGAAVRKTPVVLSYSPFSPGTAARPMTRLVSVSDLVDLAGEYFDEVRVESAGPVTHSKLNADRLNAAASNEAEILLIAR